MLLDTVHQINDLFYVILAL